MPKIVDHDKYRKELVEKCLNLFCRKGYTSVTMREIAKELNVSTGTLYHYFPTKEAIFEYMFDNERLKDVDQALDGTRDLTDIEAKMDSFIEHWDKKREYYMNLIMLAVDYFRSRDDITDTSIMDVFSDYYAKTMAHHLEVPERMGSFLFAYLIGLMYHTQIAPGSIDFHDQLKLLKEITLLIYNREFADTEKAVSQT